MSIKLEKAVEMVVNGVPPDEATESVVVDGHNFYIRPIGNRNLLDGSETGYFRHQHIGKDDRVFYAIKVNGKNSYEAKITRIQYRGPFNTGMKNVNAVVTGGLNEAGLKGKIALKVIGIIKKIIPIKVDGNWEPAAGKIVDAIGQKLASK